MFFPESNVAFCEVIRRVECGVRGGGVGDNYLICRSGLAHDRVRRIDETNE